MTLGLLEQLNDHMQQGLYRGASLALFQSGQWQELRLSVFS